MSVTTKSPHRFEAKVCLITGAATGIGRAVACQMAAEGATIALLDINGVELQKTREMVEKYGVEVLALTCDISISEDVIQAVAAVESQFGRIDVLVSNAGIPVVNELAEVTLEDWDRVFRVNTRSAFVVVKAVLPGMRARKSGAISITASTAAIVGEIGAAPYAPSKAALVNFAQQVAAEGAPYGIRCNSICPGWINTPFNDPGFSSDDDRNDTVRRQVPLGREGVPKEVATAIAFLCSQDASYVTGHNLVVDGGLTLGPR